MTKKEVKDKLKKILESGHTDVEIKCGYCGAVRMTSPLQNLFLFLDKWWKFFLYCSVCGRKFDENNPPIVIKALKSKKWKKNEKE